MLTLKKTKQKQRLVSPPQKYPQHPLDTLHALDSMAMAELIHIVHLLT